MNPHSIHIKGKMLYSLLGKALAHPLPANWGNHWRCDEYTLEVDVQDGNVAAVGYYSKEEPFNAVADAFRDSKEAKAQQFKVRIKGSAQGSVLVGEFSEVRTDLKAPSASLLALFGNTNKFIAVLEDNGATLRCMIQGNFKNFSIE